MANFAGKIRTSFFGRKVGLQEMSTAESGSGTPGHAYFLAGEVTDIRRDVTNPETTAVNLKAYGLSNLSTGSSAVHVLDPPIPGLIKDIYSSGGSTVYFKTANSETMESSRGSTFTVARFQQIGLVRMIGLTTARWLIGGAIDSTAVCALTTTT